MFRLGFKSVPFILFLKKKKKKRFPPLSMCVWYAQVLMEARRGIGFPGITESCLQPSEGAENRNLVFLKNSIPF